MTKSDVQGNILDDNCVIDSLEAMKLKGSSITEQVAEAQEIINIIDEATKLISFSSQSMLLAFLLNGIVF